MTYNTNKAEAGLWTQIGLQLSLTTLASQSQSGTGIYRVSIWLSAPCSVLMRTGLEVQALGPLCPGAELRTARVAEALKGRSVFNHG